MLSKGRIINLSSFNNAIYFYTTRNKKKPVMLFLKWENKVQLLADINKYYCDLKFDADGRVSVKGVKILLCDDLKTNEYILV